MRDSACFQCLTPAQQLSIQTYLLARDAGGSLDPKTLLKDATDNGFTTLTPSQNEAISAGLLCDIAVAQGVA